VNEIRVRDFRPDDLEAAYQLDQTCFEPGIAYTRGQIRAFLSRDGAIGLVAKKGEEMVALAIGDVAGRRGHLITIDIAGGERRRGLGRRLLAEVWARMAAAGARDVRLEVDVQNANAIRFYEQMGFRKVRPLPDYYGAGRDGIRMTRTLDPSISPDSTREPSSSR
jgi:[ribosomal protein S18]-alanine N-acetyltransferase